MSRHILVEELAEEDIRESMEYYDHQREGLGAEFLDDVITGFDRLTREPIAAVHARGSTEEAPAWAIHLSRFPFEIVFLDDVDAIRVVAVAHFKRKPGYWQGE